MSAPPAIAPGLNSAIAQGFEAEIKARLTPPAPAVAPPAPPAVPSVEPTPPPEPPIALLRAIAEADRSARFLEAPLQFARVPRILRPPARLIARAVRFALLPYLSRQQDFNHNVVVALREIARQSGRTERH